jgi:hypothetical protein
VLIIQRIASFTSFREAHDSIGELFPFVITYGAVGRQGPVGPAGPQGVTGSQGVPGPAGPRKRAIHFLVRLGPRIAEGRVARRKLLN